MNTAGTKMQVHMLHKRLKTLKVKEKDFNA